MLLAYDRSIMQRFEYRGARFAVDLPVQFADKERVLAGRCTEISKEGLRLDLGEPLQSDSRGTVSVSFQGRALEFCVRVVHVGVRHCGMEFIYSSKAEQMAVASLVESMAVANPRSRPVLLKHS
jgi:PilZ domain